MNYPHPIIAREGWPFLGIAVAVSLLADFFLGFFWSLPFWAITVFILQFFRDPWRTVFMNVFNVHSNRSPVDGTVEKRWYHAGSFFNAALDKASLENERNALWLKTRSGQDVTCVQIAGLVARRILCYVDQGAALERGQRYGFIRFGSRVDVYLPLDAKVNAALGDKVYATESVLAWLTAPQKTAPKN